MCMIIILVRSISLPTRVFEACFEGWETDETCVTRAYIVEFHTVTQVINRHCWLVFRLESFIESNSLDNRMTRSSQCDNTFELTPIVVTWVYHKMSCADNGRKLDQRVTSLSGFPQIYVIFFRKFEIPFTHLISIINYLVKKIYLVKLSKDKKVQAVLLL